MRKHVRRQPERELSSFTFRSNTPIEMSETDLTWRYYQKSHWNDDECLSQQLDNILNPDLDTHNEEKNILLMLEKLNKSEKDITYKGYALQHTIDEIVYVITNFLIKKHKRADPEKAIKKFKKIFSAGSDISTFLVQHDKALIYDSEKFDLKEYIGHENESVFWRTIQKLIIKYFQIDIEIQKSPILNWPSVWSQTFRQAISRKLKEISPDKMIVLSPNNHNNNPGGNNNNNNNNNNNTNNNKYNRFDEANSHMRTDKTAQDWYKEFLCKYDYKMDNKQKLQYIKQTKRICAGCGHSIKPHKNEIKSIIIYCGGWPTEHKFIFHDSNCVKLRKYLESIRQFVFDIEMYLNKNNKMSQLTNWQRLLYLIQNKDYILSINEKIPRPLKPIEQIDNIFDDDSIISPNGGINITNIHNNNHKSNKFYRTNFIPKTDISSFRRKRKLAQYHLQIEMIQTISFLDGNGNNNNNNNNNKHIDFEFVYGLNNSDINIPKIIKFMDIPQFGPSLFVYCLRSLEIKNRCGLWIIIQFIMCHLPTNSSIALLQKHKNELLRFPKDNLNKLCLKIIESSQFPIATSLYLCGYMNTCYKLCGTISCNEYAQLYTKIAIHLCLFIESDHLLAILLEIPSNICELSILDICIQYKLVDFLYSHRLRPIFNQMWTQFKYLNPSKSFQMKEYSYLQIFNNLRLNPSSFYYSPQGLFITEVFYFIIYIIIFTIWLCKLSYPYNLPITNLETILWIFNTGYLIKEFMEAIYKKNSYLAHFSKYWDILIVINWIIIAAIRWPWAWLTWDNYIIYNNNNNGEINEIETRNQPLTIVYMSCIGIQSILIWTRTIPFLQRSKKTGPLIHTIFRLISSVWQFTILLALFLIGCMFALYYIIGYNGNGYNLLLYMFQALFGQQDWDMLQPDEDNGFGIERSKLSEILMVFFSIIGNIALLNLLIALMASVYEQNAPLTAKQVNYSSIINTIELVEKEALLPSPFNLFVIIGLIIYFIFECFIYIISCSQFTYNITRIGWTNYSLNRDWINLESKEMEKLLLLNNTNNNQQQNQKSCHKNKYATIRNQRTSESDSDNDDDDDDVKYNNTNNNNNNNDNILTDKDEEMLLKYAQQRDYIDANDKFWLRKEFSSIGCSCDNISSSLSSLSSSKIYCRFCRNRMIGNGNIKIYFFLFRHYKTLDETDKTLLINLLINKILCPSCFRPIKLFKNGDSTRLWRWQVSMEIISFYVFMIVGYLPILIFLFIPMIFELIINRFNQWTSNSTCNNIGQYNNKQQIQLNGNNVIFGSDVNKSQQYKHISSTIHNEYYNFIKKEQNIVTKYNTYNNNNNNNNTNGKNNNNINDNLITCFTNGLEQINEDKQVRPMKPVHTKLQKNFYSNELSPVVDSPLPSNITMINGNNNNNNNNNNNMNGYNEIIKSLNEIKKEINTIKKYNKIKSNSKRRDSKNLLGKNNKHKFINNNNNNDNDKEEKEKEPSIPSMPSMPSMPSTLQIKSSHKYDYKNKKHIMMKPSKQQQKHDAVVMNQISPRRQTSNESEQPYDQQTLHDMIDDLSVGSIMTNTTVNHIK